MEVVKISCGDSVLKVFLAAMVRNWVEMGSRIFRGKGVWQNFTRFRRGGAVFTQVMLYRVVKVLFILTIFSCG